MGWKGWIVLGIGIVAFVGLGTLLLSRDEGEPVRAADLRAARGLVDRYLDAYARRDGEAICATLTPGMREVIAESDDPATCAAELAQRSRPHEDSPRGRPSVRVGDARDSGFDDGIYVSLEWRNGTGVGLPIERVDGRWLLASDQSCITPTCQP